MNQTMTTPYGGTFCMSKALLVVTGAVNTWAITPVGTLNYCINGVLYNKAAVAGGANVIVDANTAKAFVAQLPGSVAVYVMALDALGNLKVCQGKALPMDAAGTVNVSPEFPTLPNDACPFGYVVIKNATTGTAFVWGTSLWSAAGVTTTAVDIAMLPARPALAN